MGRGRQSRTFKDGAASIEEGMSALTISVPLTDASRWKRPMPTSSSLHCRLNWSYKYLIGELMSRVMLVSRTFFVVFIVTILISLDRNFLYFIIIYIFIKQ